MLTFVALVVLAPVLLVGAALSAVGVDLAVRPFPPAAVEILADPAPPLGAENGSSELAAPEREGREPEEGGA